MESDKIVWIVVIALLFLSAIALGLYMSIKDDQAKTHDNFITGNVVYESVQPDTIDPIDSNSATK